MKKAEVIKQIIEIGLVPVVRASSSDEAMRVIDAIKEGGVSVLEITMTVPGAVKDDGRCHGEIRRGRSGRRGNGF